MRIAPSYFHKYAPPTVKKGGNYNHLFHLSIYDFLQYNLLRTCPDIIHELIKNVKIGIMRNMEKKKMTQEDIMKLLDSCYEKCLNGIPMVSPGVEDMANDYLSKHETKEKACRDMLKNQIAKCTTSGVVTGLGGFITMPVAIPANIGSVIYVQMRMIACTAYMADYDLNSDQTQTFVYACLAGVAVNSLLKQAGIKFGVKFANGVIKKIPGKVLTKIYNSF